MGTFTSTVSFFFKRAAQAHLFACDEVAHALSGSLSYLVMLLKHVVFDVGQSVLFHNLHSTTQVETESGLPVAGNSFGGSYRAPTCDSLMCKVIPQLFTETSQICQASQSFIILLPVSVCVKKTNQRPNHLVHLAITGNVMSTNREQDRSTGARQSLTRETCCLLLEGRKKS